MDRAELIRVARGDAPADLLLANARVVDVLSGEIRPGSVAIAGGLVAGIGDYGAHDVVDLGGAYLAPGLIDAHVHIESSLLVPREFARVVLPRGTTTVVADPHEIANVAGLAGIRFMVEDAADTPLDVRVMASSCVPASHLATSGASLGAADLAPLAADPRVPGLAEVMNYPGVVGADPAVLSRLDAFDGRVVDGHAPGLSGRALQAYVAAGIHSDHECTTAEEALEKLRLGMTILVRESSGARNLDALLPVITALRADRFCLCTDDRHPADLLDEGHVDHLVRRAIAGGLDPVLALRLATWSPARHYRLYDRGAVAPGLRADLIAFDDITAPRPSFVWSAGACVAEHGRMLAGASPAVVPAHLTGTVHVDADGLDLRVPLAGRLVRAIGVVPDQILTESLTASPRAVGGLAEADPARDLLKIAVVERHRGTGAIGVGFVRGLGLARGAVASSVAHDHHHVVVAGADDESMRTAVRRVAELGGGLVVAVGASVAAEVPLPVAGLMSDRPAADVRAAVDAANAAARELGARPTDPFMTLSFLALEVIPHLKLTDLGLVDVDRFELVSLWADERPAGDRARPAG